MFKVSQEDYDDYIQNSPIWKQKVKDRLIIDNYRCQMCGTYGTSWNRLEIHHMNYQKPLGTEDTYRELVCLCESCHAGLHNVLCRITSADGTRGWEMATPGMKKTRPENPRLQYIRSRL